MRDAMVAYSAVASACLESCGLGARAAALALLGEGGLEARAVDRDPVLGGQLHGQVDREAVGVVELERDRAVERRGIGRQVLGATADDAAPRRSAG